MAERTLLQMTSRVQRRIRDADIGPRQIIDAINEAHREISAMYDWPWLVGEYNLTIQPSYRTGTVSIASGSAIVTGAGTAWDPTWTHKRLLLSNNTDWPVSVVSGAGGLILTQPYLGPTLTNVSYQLYQDTYEMPSNYEPGNVVMILVPQYRFALTQIDRPAFEAEAVVQKLVFTNFVQKFCEQGYDTTTRRYLVRFLPPSSALQELRLVYKYRPNLMPALDTYADIPESWAEILELKAMSTLKRDHKIEGWELDGQEAHRKLIQMRRQITSATEVHSADHASHDGGRDASFTFTIKPWGT